MPRHGTSDSRLLLVLDYPGRRSAARIADLRLESRGFETRYLLQAPFVRAMTARTYARLLLQRHSPLPADGVAVLAYCMAAPIAQELAAAVSISRKPVPMIVFDGSPSTVEAIDSQYRLIADQIVTELGASSRGDRGPRVFDQEELSGRPDEVVEAMRQRLVRLGTEAMSGSEDEGDAARIASDLAEFYLDWLIHLVAAYNAAWPDWGGDVLHVMSNGHDYARPWPGARFTEEIRMCSAREELLNTQDVLTAVESFLGRHGHRSRK